MTTVVSIRIPRSAVPRLRDFAKLPDDQAAELLAALKEIVPKVSPESLTVRLQQPLPHTTKEQSDDLITVLFNLWAVSASHNWDVKEVAESAAQYSDLEISDEDQRRLSERLYAALSIQSVAEVANAADVATEYDALFHSARCFTDIRPVFAKDVSSGISGAVVVHNLKIDYFTGGDVESLTLALTDDDVKALADILSSTKQKSAKVRDFVKASGIRFFDFADNLEDERGSSS